MKVKVVLDTLSDINEFVSLVNRAGRDVSLSDGKGFRVSGSSFLGAIYTMEWSDVYCECEDDISFLINKFIV